MKRLAIAGCGAVLDRIHGPALEKLSRAREVRVAALVDPVGENLVHAGQRFPAAVTASSIEQLHAGSIDAVLVLSPPTTHASVIGASLDAGAVVLCEKPLVPDVASAVHLIRRTATDPLALRVAMLRRQFDTCRLLERHLADLVDTGDFEIEYREGGPLKWPVKSAAGFRHGPGASGVLLDVGTHVLDLFLAFFGPAKVDEYRDDADEEYVEAEARLRVRFHGGAADIRLSRIQPLPDGWLIVSSRGQVWIPLGPESTIFHRLNAGTSWRPITLGSSSASGGSRILRQRPCSTYAEASRRQIRQFFSQSRGRLASAEDARAVLSLIEQAYGAERIPAVSTRSSA